MELLSTINLLALLLLPFVAPKIWEACWIFLLRPWMITRRFKKQGISGPKYRFIHGNLQEIKKMKKEANRWVLDPNSNDIFPRVFPHYHQWLSQYGETFLYWNGTKPTLFISDPELGKQILSSKLGFAVIAKTRPEVHMLFGKGLSFIEGDDWARHRRILNPAFSMDRLKVMTKGMVDCTLRMLEEWRRIQKSGDEVVMRMEINKDFHRLISDIIATTAFGSSYEEAIELFRSQSELEEHYVSSLANVFIPGTQYLPTPTNLHLWKLDKKVKDSIKRMIGARLKSNSMNYGDDVLGIMLKAATSEESEKTMRMDEIIEECKAIYISGQGNSTILLTWTTFLLSLHQDWQEKLREEVFNECGNKIPDSDTFSKLKLMNMVLMESLRLYGPVIKMIREATQDMKIGHLDIPKGTSIIVPFLKMHTDKAIWGEDAQRFNPMRFQNGVSQAAANHPNALLPFSVGPRTCIAQNFAMMETKTVLTMILQRFRISLSSEYKHAPVDYLNLFPQYGLPVMLQPLDTSVLQR